MALVYFCLCKIAVACLTIHEGTKIFPDIATVFINIIEGNVKNVLNFGSFLQSEYLGVFAFNP